MGKLWTPFLYGVNGKMSYSRSVGFLIVVIFLLLNVYRILTNGAIVDIPDSFTLLAVAPYSVNKISEAMKGKLGNTEKPKDQPE